MPPVVEISSEIAGQRYHDFRTKSPTFVVLLYAFSYLRLHAANRVIARSATTKQSPLVKRGRLLRCARNDMSARSLAPRKRMFASCSGRAAAAAWAAAL